MRLTTTLARAEEPWILRGSGQEAELTEARAATTRRGIVWVELDGGDLRTHDGLMAAFQRAFAIPDHFDHTWPALNECLSDLEWLPAAGWVTVIRDAHAVLSEDEAEIRTFLENMLDISWDWSVPLELGEEWDHGPTPFHWLLLAPAERDQELVATFTRNSHAEPPRIGVVAEEA